MTFNIQTFQNRQQKFSELMEPNSAALFLSAQSQHRNSDVEQKFRQDSSFWYLTGFDEPDAALLILRTKTETKTIIFARAREPQKELWTGLRAGPEGAQAISGAHEGLVFKTLEDELEKLLTGLAHFYFDFTENSYTFLRHKIIEAAKSRRVQKFTSTQNLIGELRLFKTPDELKIMRQAAQITVDAHTIAVRSAKEGLYEYTIEGKIEGYFREQGAGWAYPSIVAAGVNATILHYVQNNQVLKNGELLLIDAGCEKDYYACDITRTFPIGGKFSTAQCEIYQLVLNAQAAALKQAQVKAATFDSLHEAAVEVLAQGLLDLKLLSGSLDETLHKKTYRKFYMHRTGHWLGLDVHDVGSYIEPNTEGKSRVLRPGMVTTVEPGLYFDPSDESILAAYRGIGVRIEDDILITADGIEILTEQLPKSVAELENALSS
jgi:Xaa-Pro aminopeptidase